MPGPLVPLNMFEVKFMYRYVIPLTIESKEPRTKEELTRLIDCYLRTKYHIGSPKEAPLNVAIGDFDEKDFNISNVTDVSDDTDLARDRMQ